MMSRAFPRIDQSAAFGVAVFALVGIGGGLAMKPSPTELVHDGPGGPQVLQPVSAPRAEYVSNRSAYADFKYGIPDYVIGTDWLRPEIVEDAPEAEPQLESHGAQDIAYQAPAYVVADDERDAPYQARQVAYPSVSGDIMPVDEPDDEPAEIAAVDTADAVEPSAF